MAKVKDEPAVSVTESLQAELVPVATEAPANPVATALRMVAARLRTMTGCNDIQHGKNIGRVADELEADAKAIEAE